MKGQHYRDTWTGEIITVDRVSHVGEQTYVRTVTGRARHVSDLAPL